MPWMRIKGIKGKIWIPDAQDPSERKHACKDCDYCQVCSDIRCRACDAKKTPRKRRAN